MSTCNRLDLGSTRISAGYAQKSSQILTPNSTFFITEFDYYSSSPLGHTIFFGFDDGTPPPSYRASGHKSRNLLELDVLIPPRNEHPYAHVPLFVPLLVGVWQKR